MSSDEIQIVHALEHDILAGFQAGVAPIPVDDCTGGVYYLRAKTRRIAAVFKPADEEPYAPNNPKHYVHPTQKSSNLESSSRPENRVVADATLQTGDAQLSVSRQPGIRAGISAGDAALREVAAYLLDKNHDAGVPMTILAAASHAAFHCADTPATSSQKAKTGALQVYVPHKCTADDVASSLFSVADVHAIALLDIRLANQDRHGGNVLVVEQSKRMYKLVPIDHGACLPRVSEMEETSFLWLFWPQAKHPFSSDTLELIASMDPFADCSMLQQALPRDHQLEHEAQLTLLICTVVLQVCALEKSMSAYDIGMLMCRHGAFNQQQPRPSVLEQLVARSLEDVSSPFRAQLDQEQHLRAVASSFRRHLAAYLLEN